MKSCRLIIVLLLLNLSGHAQSITDSELSMLAENLVKEIKNKMLGHNIAIADFVDEKDQPSILGNYLAEEFSYTLVTKSTGFKVVDRTQLRRLMEESGIGDQGMIDPQSIQKLGRLEGITAVVYGKLIPAGNYIKTFVKVIILEKQVNEVTVRGNITRTPTIENLLNGKDEKTPEVFSSKEEGNSFDASDEVPTYTHQNIQIAFINCERKSSIVDCACQITSFGKDDNFSLKKNNTHLIDEAGRTYHAVQLGMNGKVSTVQVNQSLRANVPSSVIIRFKNIPNTQNHFSSLRLNCKSYTTFSFLANLPNIIIQP